MMIIKAIQVILQAEKEKDLQTLARRMWLEYWFLWSFKNMKYKKYRVKYVDIIYNYFDLERDTRYYQNHKLWNRKTYTIIWSIFRLWRIRKGLTMDEVSRLLKWDKRQIMRIEHWDSLPSTNSYYISEMLKIYQFNEDEEIKIKYWIALLQDLHKIFKKYDWIVE